MEPQIQYAKTSDGVSIAYYAVGQWRQPLIVLTPLGPSHLTMERRWSALTNWYEHISAHRTLVRCDLAGFGLSDRRVSDISRGGPRYETSRRCASSLASSASTCLPASGRRFSAARTSRRGSLSACRQLVLCRGTIALCRLLPRARRHSCPRPCRAGLEPLCSDGVTRAVTVGRAESRTTWPCSGASHAFRKTTSD